MNIYSLVENGRHQTTCWKRSAPDDMSVRFVHTFWDHSRIDPTPKRAAALCRSIQHNLQTVHKQVHCIEQIINSGRRELTVCSHILKTTVGVYDRSAVQTCRTLSVGQMRDHLKHWLIDWLIDCQFTYSCISWFSPTSTPNNKLPKQLAAFPSKTGNS